MSISVLPSHILFDIILGVVAGYVDTAIASPPAPRWMHRFSKPAIILVRDFLATQVKNGLREPPHVPIGSNLTEWSSVTATEFLAILRELVGEDELDSYLLPEIPSGFENYFVGLNEEEEVIEDDDESLDVTVAGDREPHDDVGVESGLKSKDNKELAGGEECCVAGDVDSRVAFKDSLLEEETTKANELPVDSGVEDNTSREVARETDLQSRSPVPSESLTILGSPKGNASDIDDIKSTADDEEKAADLHASDDDDGSETDGDWTDDWFQEWFALEEREPLTKNTIIHLMGVNGAFREATLKAINVTLGLKRARKKILNKRMTALLRELRMRYRLAVTPDLLYYAEHGIEAYSGPKTPLIDAYLGLTCGGYLLRCLHRIHTFQDTWKSPSLNTRQIVQRMNNVLTIAARLSPPSLKARVFQRAFIFHVRLEKYTALLQQFRRVTDAYDSVKTGQAPDAPIHLYNCPRLKHAVQEFALWDEFSMDISVFPELPRALIQAAFVRSQLREIVKLEQIEKLKANEDLMIAVEISRELFDKWHRRFKAWPDFHVVLR